MSHAASARASHGATGGKALARGVTLIELITVIGIIGLLSAIAYPSYLQYTMRGNRTDALRALTLTAQGLERCYSQTFAYNNATCLALIPAVSPNSYYNIAQTVMSATDFTLTATPNGAPQNNDSKCQSFSLSSSAGQSALDSGAVDSTKTCWGSN